MEDAFKFKVYVGTYTNGDSKGIYSFIFDSKNGIGEINLAARIHNPTYLAVDEENRHLYSVARIGEEGGVAAFSIDNSTGNLKLINYDVSQGKPPCYLSLGCKNEYVFSANYHKGTVEVLPIKSDGGVGAVSSRVVHESPKAVGQAQEQAHVHYASLMPDKRHVCAIDLGLDKLAIYNFKDGILSEAKELSLQLKDGSGPRHMDFHPSERFAYIVTELSSEIAVLEYSKLDCSFKVLQYVNALPEGFTGENSGAAVHVSPDGKYLYSSNRGHDSISIFSIDESSGGLELIANISSCGMHPRDFAIDPTGNFMLVANQNSNNIVTFKIDRKTGMLIVLEPVISIPSPVCIKFLNI